jgi:hypothetical protein
MNNTLLFTICMALTLFVGNLSVITFAQNTSQVNQTGERAEGAMNETGAAGGNITEGLGGALNQTGEALSNVTGGIMEGIKDVINGSNQ